MYLFTVRGHEIHGMYKGWMPSPKDYWCPTLDVAQKWLREVKEMYVDVLTDIDNLGVFYQVRYMNNIKRWYILDEEDEHYNHKVFLTYEKALEAGIQKCLELILENKHKN